MSREPIRDWARLLPPGDEEFIRAQEDGQKLLDIMNFRKDPWWAIQQGYVITEDEHAKEGQAAARPLPPHEFLHSLTKVVMSSPIGLVMKSRQMMLSWLFCWILLWDAIARPGRLEVAQGKREEDISAKGNKAI